MGKHSTSLRTACRLFNISRQGYHYKAKNTDDHYKTILKELAYQYPRYGYWKLYHLMRNQGHKINHKRVHRLYKALKLQMRRKTKKRLAGVEAKPLLIPDKPNQTWSIDFMTDTLVSSKRFRTLNVIDDFNSEALAIEAAASITGLRLTNMLDKVACYRGYPKAIRCDNGPELRSKALAAWAKEHGITILFIQPGKPTQNAIIERFNGTYRREILDAYLFRSLKQVQEITDQWLDEYNNIRPHASLGHVPPRQFAKKKLLL
jgi:putative transposase